MNRLSDRFPSLPLLIAFAAVYLIWGSTYLAIRFAIETIPPFIMSGVRFAMAYLTVFGSIIGLSAYVYLLRNTTAAAVGTYAFVNPVIAVFLGWLTGETFGPRAMVGASLILGAVVLIHWAKARTMGTEVAVLPPEPAIITERAA